MTILLAQLNMSSGTYTHCKRRAVGILAEMSEVQQVLLLDACHHRVGQSREILFEFGSTFATALAVSESYPTSQLAACGGRVIDPKHQIVYLAPVTRYTGAVPKCDWAARSQCGTKQRRADHAQYLWYFPTHNQSVIIITELMIA